MSPQTDIQYLKGVGPRRAGIFREAGIETVEDLLRYAPRRYEDRTRFCPIAEVRPEQEALVAGSILSAGRRTTPRRRMQLFQMVVGDGTASIAVTFFHQPYLEKILKKGRQVVLFGVPRVSRYGPRIALVNPEFEILEPAVESTIHTGRIVPIYRRLGPISTRVLRQIIFHLLESLDEIPDPLPQDLRERHHLPDLRQALLEIHFPEVPTGADPARYLELLQAHRTDSHRRMIFEEFFLFQLGLEVVRTRRRLEPKKRRIRTSPAIRETLKSILPFSPTGAQKRALGEIVRDLSSHSVMNRLLQGDVGSGKTLVALEAMVVVMENGYQTALMVPTEILAEQHCRTLGRYLEKTPYRVALLTSGLGAEKRRRTLAGLEAGEVQLVVGTHALIQEAVRFPRLALIVIDEQHRFGVLQRSRLMEKGERPETLVMTATPIPRSLALTLYGDLDLTVLDEMPPGRQPVKTVVKLEKSRAEVYRLLARELEKGRQAYIVYPLIDESEKVELKAAVRMFEHLEKVFPRARLGLVHGRLKSEERDRIMRSFARGEIQILVATTVIEVGIDVPNATVMVIENAERFGLSQLHQLRGRIGRGEHPGTCVLMTAGVRSREAYQRLDIMRRSSDGFQIAEKDLEIRGPGEFVGTRQSGLPEFRFGNLVRDRKLLEQARAEAEKELEARLRQAGPEAAEMLVSLLEAWKKRYRLYQVG